MTKSFISTSYIYIQVLLLFSFSVRHLLLILLMGLSNEARHELLPKNSKVMLKLLFITP